MTRDDITAVLIDELGRIAPEIDASRLDPSAELREELDIELDGFSQSGYGSQRAS